MNEWIYTSIPVYALMAWAKIYLHIFNSPLKKLTSKFKYVLSKIPHPKTKLLHEKSKKPRLFLRQRSVDGDYTYSYTH